VVTLHPPLLRQYGRGLVGFIRDWWGMVWWGEAVGERSGCDRFRRVCFGMAVRARTGGVYKGLVGNGLAVKARML